MCVLANSLNYRIGDMPLFESMVALFIEAWVRYWTSMYKCHVYVR